MSLCKNFLVMKNFDCIFEFIVKGYVRNTINLSCAKILLSSVIKILEDNRIFKSENASVSR
jgi:hypothetical protein